MDVSHELRDASLRLRRQALPLSDMIPLLQRAADAIDKLRLQVDSRVPCDQVSSLRWRVRELEAQLAAAPADDKVCTYCGRAGHLAHACPLRAYQGVIHGAQESLGCEGAPR
jgi:hypothetical protein